MHWLPHICPDDVMTFSPLSVLFNRSSPQRLSLLQGNRHNRHNLTHVATEVTVLEPLFADFYGG